MGSVAIARDLLPERDAAFSPRSVHGISLHCK